MLREHLGRRVAAGFAAAVLTSAMVMPGVALADGAKATATYGTSDTTGGNETQLALIYNSDLGPDSSDTFGKANCKVVVPAKITFVAKPDGSIVGPGDTDTDNSDTEKAAIRNYSPFKVHVSGIEVTVDSPYSLASSCSNRSALTDDQLYLTVQPGDKDQVALQAGVSTTLTQGNWNIDQSTSAGTDFSDLKLSFAGNYNSFTNLTMGNNAENNFAKIGWTVALGHEGV